MQNKKYFVGTCQHDIDEDWYYNDDSSYTLLDEPSGAYVSVTTCRSCREENELSGLIIDPDDIPVDDFVNPFADNPAPDVMKVVNPDGSTTLVELGDAPAVSEDELNDIFRLTNKVH